MRANMIRISKGLSATLLLAALVACGSGLSSGGSSSSSGSGGGGTTVGSSLVELGSGNGTSFKNGTLAIQVGTLPAGSTTGVTATIVDANSGNALYTQSITINFTSNCAGSNLATITSPVVTSTGTASTSYTAKGCSGNDTITATALIGTATLTATGIVKVSAAKVQAVQFISATPSAISMLGVGGVSSSEVTFQVNDANGNPVPNETVDFSLNTTAGGITFSPSSASTGANGQASTFIQSGTVHTSVVVTATVRNTGISQSTPNAISISTGIPVQTHFSLAILTHNLSQSYDHDSTPDEVDVFAVDRYGNPATPGTNVLFITNSGVIFGTCPGATSPSTACGSCQTDATGFCKVTWESEGNRPASDGLNIIGHAHILAYTIGEEHYIDNDQDGVFDSNDTFSPSVTDSFYGLNLPLGDNIGDPYMDSNENGAYDSGESYVNIANSHNLLRRVPDGKWYGAGCGGFGATTASVAATGGTVTCANALTMIGKDDCIVMSTDHANIGAPSALTAAHTGDTVTITVADLNGNVIGSGSTLTVQTVSVQGVTLSLSPAATGGATYTQADQGCSAPGAAPAVQTFTITVTPQNGATTFGGQFYLLYTAKNGTTDQSAFIQIL